MDPRVSAMLKRQAEEGMLVAQDRSRAAERTLSTYVGWLKHGVDAGFFDLSTFDGWLDHGVAVGFCGEELCIQHDGTPFTADEAELFEAGDDPCVPMVRIFPDGDGYTGSGLNGP